MKNINQSKKVNVTKVFNEVFSKYDLMNDLMALGAHRAWKSRLIDWMSPKKNDHLIDVALFYQLQSNTLVYFKLSASSNYLLGENPLAYNRRSNHLFDHPYGQIYVGLLLNF